MLTFSLTEGAFLLWVQEFVRNAVLDPLVCFYTKLGNHGMLWIALCLLMLLWPRTRRAGAAGALALVFSYLVTNVTLKHLVARTRPWLTLEGLIPLVVEPDPNSFPSGHTSAALAAAVAWRRAIAQGLGGGRSGGRRLHGTDPALRGGPLPQRCALRRPGGHPLRGAGLVSLPAVAGPEKGLPLKGKFCELYCLMWGVATGHAI